MHAFRIQNPVLREFRQHTLVNNCNSGSRLQTCSSKVHSNVLRLTSKRQSSTRKSLRGISALDKRRPVSSNSMDAAKEPQSGSNAKVSVLFVCLGNICRSPSAEAVFKAIVEREGVADRFCIDSCGTGGGSGNWYKDNGRSYHEGDASDTRMQAAARRRGMHLTSRSRPLTPDDLCTFDYIIGMDDKNLTAIKTATDYWSEKHAMPSDVLSKVSKMTQYLGSTKFKGKYDEVPDPWYAAAGEDEGFELVLDLLEDSSEHLLRATGICK